VPARAVAGWAIDPITASGSGAIVALFPVVQAQRAGQHALASLIFDLRRASFIDALYLIAETFASGANGNGVPALFNIHCCVSICESGLFTRTQATDRMRQGRTSSPHHPKSTENTFCDMFDGLQNFPPLKCAGFSRNATQPGCLAIESPISCVSYIVSAA
jgi:hypothetical protein